MRRALVLLALGIVGVGAQGAMVAVLPGFLVPDVSLVMTVAAALLLGPFEGLVVAVILGLSADLLSGSLLGQQALLRTLELPFTRLVSAQLDLRRGIPLGAFVLGLSLLDATGMLALGRVFLGPLPLAAASLWPVATRILANAALAPLVVSASRRLVEKLDESRVRKEMHLDTRRPVL